MNKSDPRAERSRRALLDAGIDTLLANADASLSEIAQRAGVGRATLYRHFETREQLILALAIESLEETDRACEPIREQGLRGRAAIEAMFRLVMPLADRFHFLLSLWNLVERDPEVVRVYENQMGQLEQLLAQARQEGSIGASVPSLWLVCLIDSLVYSGWYCVAADAVTCEEASELAITAFFDGVG